LLGQVLNRSPAWLMTHDDFVLADDHRRAFDELIARRATGEPMAYILGHREFFGREFLVSPAVLIPRPETELLVEVALARIDATGKSRLRVLDLGTGSGCIAITLALERPQLDVTAVDVSAAALAVAQANAQRLGVPEVRLRFVASDWFAEIEGYSFDLIVANPPYIAAEDAHIGQGDLRFEPATALASGKNGQAALRNIVAAASRYLRPQGELWFEHGYDQAPVVSRLLAAVGFTSIMQYRDLAGILRVSGGRHDSS